MSNEFDTEKQEQDYFTEISRALRDGDEAALDKLTQDNEPVVVEEVVPVVEEEVVEEAVVTEPETTESVSDNTVVQEVVEDDPVATIAELREKLKAQETLNHKLKSDAGRVPMLQRKLAEVDNKLREMATQPSTNAAATREDKRVLSEKLAQIKEHDPLLADAMSELVNEAISNLRQEIEPKVNAATKVFEDKELEIVLDQEMGKLTQVVPNAIEVFQSDSWKEWKNDLPNSWRSLAESLYAEDVLVAMQRYAKDVYARHPELTPQQTQQTSPASGEALKVQESRKAKLTTSTPGTQSVSAKDIKTLDEEALFAEIYKKETAKFKR